MNKKEKMQRQLQAKRRYIKPDEMNKKELLELALYILEETDYCDLKDEKNIFFNYTIERIQKDMKSKIRFYIAGYGI